MSVNFPEVRVGQPLRYKSLSVFPLFAESDRNIDYLLADEAIGEKLLTVEEVSEAGRIRTIAEAAAAIGCQVGLYNHGGWFGEPENQIAIIEKLKLANVGIVCNLHHGHQHLDRFAELLDRMKLYLLALNLNGMDPGGDQQGKKILPLGAGKLDLQLLRTIRVSG